MAYAESGVKLILSGRQLVSLEAQAAKCRARGAAVDVAIADVRAASVMERLLDAHRPEMVIAAAGVSGGSLGGAEDAAQARAIFDTNLMGTVNTVAPALPYAKRVVVISSMAGFRGLPSAPAYSASKCAVRAWGQALAGLGLPVTVACPGFVRTAMTAKNGFAMPFMLDADKAARIIKAAADKGRAQVIFPLGMRCAAFLLKYLPEWLLARLVRRLPGKQAMGRA